MYHCESVKTLNPPPLSQEATLLPHLPLRSCLMFLWARARLGLEKLGPAPPLTRTFWVLPDQLVKTTAIAETSKSDFYPDKKNFN